MIKTMLAIRLIKDFLILLIVLFIAHFFVKIDIIDGTFSSYLMAIGLIWVIGTIVFLPFEEFPYCFFTLAAGIVLFCIGALTNENMMQQVQQAENVTIEEIGNHPQAVWSLYVTYQDPYGGMDKCRKFTCTGTTEEANISLMLIQKIYYERNPSIEVTEMSKELISVPEEHARKVGADTFYRDMIYYEGL